MELRKPQRGETIDEMEPSSRKTNRLSRPRWGAPVCCEANPGMRSCLASPGLRCLAPLGLRHNRLADFHQSPGSPTDIVEHGDLFQRGQQQFDELLVGGVGEVDLKPGLVFEGDEEAVGVALVVGLG